MARDKVCVVIGAGDATGGAIARRFAREGFTAVVTRRSADKLQHLVAQITKEGGKVHPFGSDARDEVEVEKLFRRSRPRSARSRSSSSTSAATSASTSATPRPASTARSGR